MIRLKVKIVSIFASALTIAACVQNANPYLNVVKPDGTSTIFRYGNFCGPSLPDGLSGYDPVTEKKARSGIINSMQPIDSIDGLCQKHDLCYEQNGHDSFLCDASFGLSMGTLDLRFNHTATGYDYGERATIAPSRARKCGRLTSQISTAFVLKQKHTGVSSGQRAFMYGWQAAGLPLVGIIHYLGSAIDEVEDYPKPGECKDNDFNPKARFDLEYFRGLCNDKRATSTYVSILEHVEAFPICRHPPFAIQQETDATRFEEIEAKWARVYCMKDLDRGADHFVYEGRGVIDITSTIDARYKAFPACRRYLNQTHTNAVVLRSPWKKHIR